MKNWKVATFALASMVASVSFADTGKVNWPAHPNLQTAYNSCSDALMSLSNAQSANDWDLAGNAANAKSLIAQAQSDIAAARNVSNNNSKGGVVPPAHGVSSSTAIPVDTGYVTWPKHPNLQNAYNACSDAISALAAAQSANDWDLAGNAANAKGLLAQAQTAIDAARNTANSK
jgi:hypothetical protein